jgi:hypothetical protein
LIRKGKKKGGRERRRECEWEGGEEGESVGKERWTDGGREMESETEGGCVCEE